MDRVNWSSLIRSIDSSRSGRARFFKPVCVIAAVDLADEGRLDAENIDGDAIQDRFADYVTPFFRDRGNDGYQPLWHLSNNQLWTFYKEGRALTSKEFRHGKPGTKAKLANRYDRLSINDDYSKLWRSKTDRRILRDEMLLMLERSDGDSRRLVAPLFDARHLLDEKRWPTKGVLNAYFAKLADQQLLFEDDPLEGAPTAVEDVPSAIDYVWSDDRITVGPNQASIAVFPFDQSERDHASRLEACAILSEDLVRELQAKRWQVREDYLIELRHYLERLPEAVGTGNILLADASARVLRDMFAAEASILPYPFAAKLKALLQQHTSIRPFYPEVDGFYRAVTNGRLDRPLPLDAVNDIKAVLRDQTPSIFDRSVSEAIGEASAPEPEIGTVAEAAPTEGEPILPPPDPVGELDPKSAHAFQVAGVLNRLWKVFTSAEKVRTSTNAWMEAFQSLNDPMKSILEWLHHYLNR